MLPAKLQTYSNEQGGPKCEEQWDSMVQDGVWLLWQISKGEGGSEQAMEGGRLGIVFEQKEANTDRMADIHNKALFYRTVYMYNQDMKSTLAHTVYLPGGLE